MDTLEFCRRSIGVPFIEKGRSFSGWDCWGLVFVAHKECFGISVPTYTDSYIAAKPSGDLARLISAERDGEQWIEICPGDVVAGDVVLLRVAGRPVHVGLSISGKTMLHVEAGIDTCLEKFDGPLWANRVIGFWRHADR